MVSNSGFFCVAAVHLLLACAALNRLRTTTKNTGTKNTASTVPVTMPPSTPVPMARWLAEPAPLAMGERRPDRMPSRS